MLAATIVFSSLPRIAFRDAVTIALILAAVVWVRDAFMLLPLAFVIAIIWFTGFKNWKKLLLMLLVFTFTIFPWMARNSTIEGGGLFMSKGIASMSLYVGTWQRDSKWVNDWLHGRKMPDHAFDSAEERLILELAMQIRNDEILKNVAIDRIKDRPLAIFSIWLQRVPYMWLGTRTDLVKLRFDTGSPAWILFKSFMWGINFVVVFAGLLGMILFGVRKTGLIVFSGVIGYVFTSYLPFLNIETRYSIPALVWLYLFALLFVEASLKAWQNRSLNVFFHQSL
jgi:hypothetical protein